jgi:transposase
MEKQGTGAKQRSYTEEYKREAAALARGGGRPATVVAAEIGVHPTLLYRWMKRYAPEGSGQPGTERPPPASPSLKPLPIPTADQAAEIARLRRENERLRMERDILKKGIAIFAVPSR